MVNLLADYEPILVKHFDEFDLSPMMVYLIDVVDASALPFLAKQFKVDGYRGYELADTEVKKRELIKSGIEIAKHVGTPYAIKRALAALGYTNVTIIEGVGVANYYNGLYYYDGNIDYGGTGGESQWVNFSVEIRLADASVITSDIDEKIRLLINEYKNARSVLVDLTYIEI